MAFEQANRVIKEAMQNAGLLARGQTVTADETEEYIGRLNNLLLFEQTQGLKLWTNYEQPISAPILQVGKKDYSIGVGGDVNVAQPKRVLQGIFIDASGNRRSLLPNSREEYNRLSTITQQGAVNSYYFDKKKTLPVVSFWMVPDATTVLGSVVLTLQRPLTRIVTDLDSIDLPEEWFLWISWALSADICTGQPDSIVTRCEGKSLAYRQMIEDWDVEDADTRFAPDPQMAHGTGRFL